MKGIDKLTIFFLAMVFLGWGTSVFFDKLAANRLGMKGTTIYLVSLLPSLAVLLFYLFWGYKIYSLDRIGVLWVIISSVLNIGAIVFYYLVFLKAEASWAAAITALYPICTIILAFIFLKETITVYRIIGIILAMLALIFLSI